MNLFKNIKIKGFDKHKVKSKIPKVLKSVKGSEKPLIEFNFGDRINQFTMWLKGFVIDATGQIIKRIIPGWFWIALIVVIIIVIIL